MTQSRIGTLQAVKTILEEMNYNGIEHPYKHYDILSELEEMIEEMKQDLRRNQKWRKILSDWKVK